MISLDSNVLIYAIGGQDLAKQNIALQLVADASANQSPVCLQVFGEVYSVVTRKQLATREEMRSLVIAWKTLMTPLESSSAAHGVALDLATKHGLQYWDALIIATCAEHGVTELFTEDAPGVKKPLGVKCTNPFK
jgi:predicted nucleic acid-binding protein